MQATANRPQPTQGAAPAPDADRPSTWWLVITRAGTEMLTLCPDTAYAPVNVYENGYLVSIRARERCTPAERPDVRLEVRPDYSAHEASCRVPYDHPAGQAVLRHLKSL
ncbi:hypothetical protein AB0F20_10385 [Streptomyces goshikiensis]|uniref:hypothetical protein n=1 Tax=Streptomyces goshikiensis TaxID=1942 RepID=UPI0033C782E5